MFMYDYIIVGGGVTGITVALALSYTKRVALIEKTNTLGGCWSVEWINNKYFHEHAPRVLSIDSDMKDLFDYIGITNNDIKQIYGSYVSANITIIQDMLSGLSFTDLLKIICSKIAHSMGILEDQSVSDWENKWGISNEGRKQIYKISLLMADSPDKLKIKDMLHSLSPNSLTQFTDPEKWIYLAEKLLIQNGCHILKKSEIVNIKNNKCYLDNNRIIKGKKIVLCIDPKPLYNLLLRSNLLSNWKSTDSLAKSFYSSIDFQIHFFEKVDFPKKWMWSFDTKYKIISVPVSNYAKIFSKDHLIQSVLSCTIIDQTLISHSDPKKIIYEGVRQIMDILKYSGDYIVTHGELYQEHNKFVSKRTGYVRTSSLIPFYGKNNKIAIVGPYNDYGVATFGKSVSSGIKFVEEENIKVIWKKSQTNLYLFYSIIIIIFIILYFYF